MKSDSIERGWDDDDWPPEPKLVSVDELLTRFAAGERDFHFALMDGADLSGANLEAVRFYGASLKGANFDQARLTHVQFKSADLTGATLRGAVINASDSIAGNFTGADFTGADMTGNSLDYSTLEAAILRDVNLGGAALSSADLAGADFTGATLSHTDLSNLDVSRLCDSEVEHHGASTIDAMTVLRSYQHGGLKRFMGDCGVPPLFSEFMIECARATSEGALMALMQSTFISYGGPDEEFARRLYNELRSHQVIVFYFPESATLGERIDQEVYRQLKRHDRVILVCSENSLNRSGVLHEIRETLDRESRDGGATYLLPVTLDDYLFTGWREPEPELAERLGRRVVGDFRGVATAPEVFDRGMKRLLTALMRTRPGG